MDMYILSDPVTNFWKCPKKRFKRVLKGGSNWNLFFPFFFLAWWPIGQTNFVGGIFFYLSELKTRGVLGSLRVRFWIEKTIFLGGGILTWPKYFFLGEIGFFISTKKGRF